MKITITVLVIIGIFALAGTLSKAPLRQPGEPTAMSSHQSSHLSVVEFATLLSEQPDRVVVDVRTAEEFQAGHISGAVSIDFYDPNFIDAFGQFEKDQPLAVYCRSGNRSGQALELLASAGYANVVDLSGGIVAWQELRPDGVCTAEAC